VFKYFSEKLSEEMGVLVRYARKSSGDYVEEQPQQVYPCVAIQDYTPTPREDWWIEHKPFHRANSQDGKTAYLYYLPMWMQFRYDVSIAAKHYKEYCDLQQWFIKNVIGMDEITLESIVIGGVEVGEPIPIESRSQDVPRKDGVFETDYEVTFSVWLYAREPEGVAAVQDIVVRMQQADFIVVAGGESTTVKKRRLTDYLGGLVASGDYVGIRTISASEYEALEEKDPKMVYVIH
jgi:hypothetical protein